MGSKRKHNQSSTAGTGQTDVLPSPKKAKVDRAQANSSLHQSPASSKLPATSPDLKRQAIGTTQTSAKPEQDTTSGLSKSARKRLRKRQALRGAKKPLSADKTEQAAKEVDIQRPSKKPSTESTSAKPKASHTKAGSKSSSNDVTKSVKTHIAKPRSDRPPPKTGTAFSKKSASKTERSDPVKQKSTLQQSNVSVSQVATKASLGANARKRERRRQKLALWKREKGSSSGQAPKREHRDLDETAPGQDASTSSAKGVTTNTESPRDASILHQTTQTTLLPVPKKEWIDETEQDSPVTSADLRKEVTQTSLMPRPTKEWVEQDALIRAGDPISTSPHAVDGPKDIPANDIDASPIAANPTFTRSPPASSAHSSRSSSPKDPQPTEAERPFATVGLPPITQPSATRPGINTIASFSLSSRRHPVDVLAKGRKFSGLSGMRMDTGNVGSATKPVSSLKASSVPSYSGRGDVKAAFAAFNKFAHGGESSDSDDESDESESEVEAQVAKPAASNTAAPIVAPSVTTEVRAPQNSQDDGAGQPDSTAHTDNPAKSESNSSDSSSDKEDSAAMDDDEVSKSHETQENDECVAETPPNSNPNDLNSLDDAYKASELTSTQSPDKAPRLSGQQDLPLFSDFKAQHDMQPTDDPTKRPTAFLGQDLGANISDSGPDPSPIDDDQLTSSLQVPIGDYQASQEADELYQTIEDISREVFGSTRALPDCKPPSNSLDTCTTPEPFVTDLPSGHGVDLQSLQQKTPDKDVALGHITRGSSPMVYIVGGVDVAGETTPDVGGSRLGDDDGRDTEGGPVLVDKKAETERYSSPQSSLSTLTASPTPDRSPNPAQASIHSAQISDKSDENPRIETLDDPLEANDAVVAAEKKNRKMTGTSSKHFSPRKQPSRQINKPIKPESIDDIKPSILEDLEEHPELSLVPDDLPKPTKTKKKGTGKTSDFFTPTSSPVKATTTPKSKSRTPRVPAGTSTCPVPPTTSAHFGLIQEKLWQTPFWLLIAVTFLNKTTGRSAVPIFRSLQTLYPTPEDLAQADHQDLVELIATLGLQNQRAKKLVAIAKTWCENPPVKGKRYRCLHYPEKGDGKEYKKDEVIEDESDDEEEEDGSAGDVRGALEIAHIPGCGPYAWDSWRIFCRDVLRGLAEDYNGKGAAYASFFVPEWQRVLPLDKELRACLRWMWLREGWVWDCESGAKRAATEEERRAGELGEMSFGDEGEEKFAEDAAAAAAAAVGDGDVGDVGETYSGNDDMGEELVEDVVTDEIIVPVTPAAKKTRTTRSGKMAIARRELDVVSGDEVEMSSLRRSRRKRTG